MSYTLIQTAHLNNIDPQTLLSQVLARMNEHPARNFDAVNNTVIRRRQAAQDGQLHPANSGAV